MVLDPSLVIQEVIAVSEITPGSECPQVARAYESLKGLRVEPGFSRAVKERVQGVKGCTHLTELIGPMATVADQTFSAHRRSRSVGQVQVLAVADSCFAFRKGADHPHSGKQDMNARQGPLVGTRVLEFGDFGPESFCAMLLAHLGSKVIARRGKRSIGIDLKDPADLRTALALALVDNACAIIEGLRPGVILGLGTEDPRDLSTAPANWAT